MSITKIILRPEVFYKEVLLKICAKFKKENTFNTVLFNKVARCIPGTTFKRYSYTGVCL